MNWGAYSAIFSLATFKFMFAAFPGPALGLSFIETFLCVFFGGTISAAVFYFSSDFFMLRASQKRIKKMKRLEEEGNPIKKFTFINKFIVRCKSRFGMYVVCFWAPFFLSVPLGSIVVAKFYGKLKYTFLYVFVGMVINASITTFLAYVIF
jgi:hypothetical protein